MVMNKLRSFVGIFIVFMTLGSRGIWTAEAADFSGNWQGSWTSSDRSTGNLSAGTAQSGATLCGKLSVFSTDCGDFNNLSLSGTASGNVASFLAVAICPVDGSSNELRFTQGSLSGNTMTGNYAVYSNGVFFDSGTFRLTKSVPNMSGSPEPRYRVYNPNDGQHHYTTDPNEYCVLGSRGWKQEGISCYLYSDIHQIGTTQTVPYYRLYNPNSYEHHWTTDDNEYHVLGTIGWKQEGVDGDVFSTQVTGSQPLYRLYNSNNGQHHWTMDGNERRVLIGYGWKDEGIACYVSP
jgi:hypothetical protein